MNLANLAKLNMNNETQSLLHKGGKSKPYEKCKDEIISDTIHSYKDKELKTRAGKTVKNPKQAIAIALSETHSKCERNKMEAKKLIEKVNNDLNNDKELNLTNLIETGDSIILLLEDGKSKRVYMFKKLLWDKIIRMQINGETIDKNMWNEIKKIHNL
jgi:predicted  nucleic acid-binding Zn-ribbon protein